jgi:dTDP-4-dehydrorhamnose reductase
MQRIAITGAGGQLGRQLLAALSAGDREVLALTHANFDITAPESRRAVIDWRPDVIVNAAAWTDVDGCARDPGRAMAINGIAPGALAKSATAHGIRFIQVSTNEVFDGADLRKYGPDDEPRPINPYGASKLAAERAVLMADRRHRVVRTAWLFGPGGTNFVTKILAAAQRAAEPGDVLRVVRDEVGNPTWTPALAAAIAAMVEAPGDVPIVHAVGTPPASRLAWAEWILESAGLQVGIEPVSLAEFSRASTPPMHAVLEPSPGLPSITWRDATSRYVTDLVAVSEAGMAR